MNVGEFTERVRFVERSRTRMPGGGYDTSDETLGEVWAAVKASSAGEGDQSGRRYTSTVYTITLHADDKPAGLSTAHFVIWLTKRNITMNIRAIREEREADLALEIVAEAGAVPPGPVSP